MVKYCPRCGAQVTDEARFCPKCGFDFSTLQQSAPSTSSQQPPQQPPYQPPPSNPPTYQQPTNPPPYQQPPYQQPPYQPNQPPYQPPPSNPPTYQQQTESLISTANKAARYTPMLTKYGKLLLLLSIIFEALTTILVSSCIISSLTKISAPASDIAPLALLLVSAVIYLISPVFSAFSRGINISKLTMILAILAFILLGITYIVFSKESGYTSGYIGITSITIYGTTFTISITTGIIILIGAALVIFTLFINMGGFINSIIQIVGIILIYIYTVSNNFNFESMLWGIALIIALIFNMIPSFYRGNYLQMATGIGYSIAVLLFTIGMIITGASQVSAPSPSSLGISGGIINGAYGTYIAAGAIGIIAGIIGLIDSIFILIYTLAYKAMPNL